MRARMIAMVLAVLLAACATEVGPAGGGGAAPTTTPPGESATPDEPTTTPPGEPATPDGSGDGLGLPRPSELETDLGRQPSGPVGQDIETAFVGRVVAIDEGGSRPWVTFAVERWFTDDLGDRIGLWARGFDGAVGQDWLVASTRFDDVTGDVLPGESVPLDEAALVSWEDRYGGSVTPGADTPERPEDLDVVAAVEAGRDTWSRAQPPAWTATIMRWERGQVYGECGSGRVRTVVEDGEVVEAFDLDAECDVTDPLTMPEVFDLAEQWSGAAEEPPTFDEHYGWVETLWAHDRSIEASISVTNFVPAAHPIARDPQDQSLADARTRWEAADIDDYQMVVELICFCGFVGPFDVEVEGGEMVAMKPGDPDAGAEDYRGNDLTVDAIFDQIVEANESGEVDVSYDPDLGYPTWAFLDYLINAVDDEMEFVVTSLEPTG